MLNQVFFSLGEGTEPKVSDLLINSSIASPATIHAALKKLLAKNLISYRTISDNRSKFIGLTKQGLKRYNDLSKALG